MIESLTEFLQSSGIEPESFAVVFDIGSRDARQAVELSKYFPRASIFAVECNPDTLERCRRNIVPHSRIKLIEQAINIHTGRCAFYPVDAARTVTAWADGNPGASSLFRVSSDYPAEKYVQKKIEVNCIRLDDLCRELRIWAIDLIWIDLQGAELLAFQSAGELLERVRYIYTEVSFRPIYEGQCLYDDVNAFLISRGFRRRTAIDPERWQQDVIYENTRDLMDVLIVAGGDHESAALSARSARNLPNVRHIFVCDSEDPRIDSARFIPLSAFAFAEQVMAVSGGENQDVKKYLQQLTKICFPAINGECLDNVLVVDPGTLFLQPCHFIQDGRPVLNFGDAYYAPHFEHMARLLPSLHRMIAYSGIAHCMLLRRQWAQQLMRETELAHNGDPFWKNWLSSVDPAELANGASEAEVWFNFCLRYHAEDIVIRRFRWATAESIDMIEAETLDYIKLANPLRTAADRARLDSLLSLRATPSKGRDADEWARYAGRLFNGERYTEASKASDEALAIDPRHALAARHGIHARLHACDWRRREQDRRRISDGLAAGENIIASVFHRAICDSEAESLALARLRARNFPHHAPLWRGERYRHDRIRVGYISSDLRDHVVSRALIGCFEAHDRKTFDFTAISYGPNDGSAMRHRLESTFEHFLDAHKLNNSDIAKLIRDREIDILVDLNGYSGKRRTEIVALRPAPLQINYLGYPGTMAVPFIDYIIADRVTIPEENRGYYTEQVVWLPHTYMPASRPTSSAAAPSRRDCGLPDEGFVFASFNYIYKCSPEIFRIWMRLLRAVEGSVLWLRTSNADAIANLRREAQAHEIYPQRLVFAPFVPHTGDHLARFRNADLFLDTLPYNAHVTACEALWEGLPVVTCLGNTFPGRVAASVLHAIGMPELIAASPAAYEALALSLARDREKLAAIRKKLLRNRDVMPLFDSAGFARALEFAYTMMWQKQQQGSSAIAFSAAW